MDAKLSETEAEKAELEVSLGEIPLLLDQINDLRNRLKVYSHINYNDDMRDKPHRRRKSAQRRLKASVNVYATPTRQAYIFFLFLILNSFNFEFY